MKLNHQLEQYSENNRAHLSCQVYDNYNKVSYLQRNKKCCNLETQSQKKATFFQETGFSRSYYLTSFQIPFFANLKESHRKLADFFGCLTY